MVWLIVGVTLARIVYLFWLCPYELVEDEAHYWEWSRRLGLSYYSKGPGVAWSIAASTWLLGTTEAAIRLPSVLAAGVSSWSLAALARDIFRDRAAGLYAASLFNLAPVFQFASLVMTIDSPYVACWTVACHAGWRAAGPREESRTGSRAGWWALLGLALGAGFLYKYTILLLLPGILAGWWLVRRRSTARQEQRVFPGALIALAAFAICASPVLIWNIHNGWPTVRHLLGHLGVSGGDVVVKAADSQGGHYNPVWTLELVAVQGVMMGATTAAIIAGLVWRRRLAPTDPARSGSIYLVACAVPILLFYLAVTFFARAEGNWPVAGFVSLLALAGGWMGREVAAISRRPTLDSGDAGGARRARPFVESVWRASVIAGLIVGVLMLRVDLLARVPGLGAVVPIGRLIGAREQARHVDEIMGTLRQRTGQEPMVLVQHYGQASRLAFYLPGRPVVLCASSYTGGRKTQFDYWPDTDLSRPDLIGKPGIIVGGEIGQWQAAFKTVEPIGQLRGETKKDRQSFLGFEYKGFAPAPTPPVK